MDINALPAEILLQIFFFAVSGIPSTCSAPLNVSHTCHDWRRLAISESKLWSIYDDRESLKKYKYDDEGHIKLWLQQWLLRAGEHAKLEIQLSNSITRSHGDGSEATELLKELWETKRQWNIFRILIDRNAFYSIPDLVFRDQPRLTELYLPSFPILPLGPETDREHFCTWKRIWIPEYDSLSGPIAPSLRILQCGSVSRSVIMNTLRHCPNIVELRLTDVPDEYLENWNFHEEDGDPCVLPALTKLYVAEPIQHIISHRIQMPALSTLVVDTKTCVALTEAIRAIPRFVRESGARPRSIALMYETELSLYFPNGDDLRKLFESVPDVEKAVLGFCASKDLSALLLSPQLLPKLSVLTFSIREYEHALEDAKSMLESRFAPSATFHANVFPTSSSHGPHQRRSWPEFKETFGAWEADGLVTLGVSLRDYARPLSMFPTEWEYEFQRLC